MAFAKQLLNPRPITRTAKRPLRVCHVSLTLKTGGLERILKDLARHHDRTSCEPEFLAIRDVGRFADEIREEGGTVVIGEARGVARRAGKPAEHPRDGDAHDQRGDQDFEQREAALNTPVVSLKAAD